MSTPNTLQHLQSAAQDLAAEPSSSDRFQALSKAFELFSKETVRLENAYRALQQRFQSVNVELEEKNRALKEKNEELDATTHYLESILHNIYQGMIFINLEGTITTYNRVAERLLEVPSSQVLERPFWKTFPDTLFDFSMKQILSERSVPELGYVDLHGRKLEIHTTFSLQEHDSAKGVIILVADITEVRRLQAINSRNDRMKELGEMAASVAHEIRNPLGGIKGFASLLYRDLADRPLLQQMAKQIVDGSETLDRLVNDVLNYSRPIQIQPELCDLHHLISELLAFFEADDALGKNVTIELDGQVGLSVPIDQQLFRNVLLNLLTNASQAMKGEGTITLRWQKDGSRAVVSITDTGSGIAPKDLENIFSPFFTTKPKGNGFGLSEVHKIIQAHGGTIDVTSTLGTGTIFTIGLPLKA